MPQPLSLRSLSLCLAGRRWRIHAADSGAVHVVAGLAEAMALPEPSPHHQEPDGIEERRLYVWTNQATGDFADDFADGFAAGPLCCFLPPPIHNDILVLSMSYIGLAIARAELARGGLLLHGALAAAPAHLPGGVLLAGGGGVGKSTASRRLPPPWQSLSDDSSLVVCDERGGYLAHPWPTWSRLYDAQDGGPGAGGRWEVQRGLPLRAIFFLSQANEEQVETLAPTVAAAYLLESVRQVSAVLTRNLRPAEAQPLFAAQLAAAEQLVRTVPVYTLRLSLTGSFWQEIEHVLAAGCPSCLPGPAPDLSTGHGDVRNNDRPPLFGPGILPVRFSGTSMVPTLCPPDILEVVPCAGQPVSRGDVIFFTPPTGGEKLVHRVTTITVEGLRTRGDNGCPTDPFLVPPAAVIGRVVRAWRNGKPRPIAGGARGLWTGWSAGWRSRTNRLVSTLLRGLYRRLAAEGGRHHLLPATFQPRVFAFGQRRLPPVLKLLVNGRSVGRYDAWLQRWQIDRPWRLLIDPATLPVPLAPETDPWMGNPRPSVSTEETFAAAPTEQN